MQLLLLLGKQPEPLCDIKIFFIFSKQAKLYFCAFFNKTI